MSAPPLFRDGERLSAARLNELVDYFRDAIQRLALGAWSPGVVTGLEVRREQVGSELRLVIEPGLAIAADGRILTNTARLVLNRSELARELGGLRPGLFVRPWLVPRRPLLRDPCAPTLAIDSRPEVVWRPERRELVPGTVLGDGAHLALLPMRALDDAEGGVALGSIEVLDDEELRVSTHGRMVMTARHDAVRNSRGDVVLSFEGGHVEAHAPIRGRDVRATSIGVMGREATAEPLPSDPRVFALAPSMNGPSGVLAYSVRVAPKAAPILRAGVPLELHEGDEVVVGPARVGGVNLGNLAVGLAPSGSTSSVLIGLSAGAAYELDGRAYVPVAQAGLITVRVLVEQSALAAGTWLTARGADVLGPASAKTTVLARLAQKTPAKPGVHEALAFVVSPHEAG